MCAVLALPAALFGQGPPQAAPLPPPLFVRLAGPAGMTVTVYRGGPQGEMLNTPCVIAFRPGYRYRIATRRVARAPSSHRNANGPGHAAA